MPFLYILLIKEILLNINRNIDITIDTFLHNQSNGYMDCKISVVGGLIYINMFRLTPLIQDLFQKVEKDTLKNIVKEIQSLKTDATFLKTEKMYKEFSLEDGLGRGHWCIPIKNIYNIKAQESLVILITHFPHTPRLPAFFEQVSKKTVNKTGTNLVSRDLDINDYLYVSKAALAHYTSDLSFAIQAQQDLQKALTERFISTGNPHLSLNNFYIGGELKEIANNHISYIDKILVKNSIEDRDLKIRWSIRDLFRLQNNYDLSTHYLIDLIDKTEK